jgi:hypothetical protein
MLIPPRPPPTSIIDTECYKNYWLCCFSTGEEFELFDGHPLDIAGLVKALQRYTLVTFNGNNYDMPLITLAIGGADNARLKQASDAIIVGGMKPWEIARVPDWIDHIDLFDVAPGEGSLKSYAARMHSTRLQDLPVDPSALIDEPTRQQLRDYCRNSDLPATADLLATFPTQLELRRDMGREYGIDLRSKSDAQIAEVVMKRLLPFKVERPPIPYGEQFYYRPPAWLKFINMQLLQLMARAQFAINEKGGVTMCDELAGSVITVGAGQYKMGIGGLHGSVEKVTHITDDTHEISDHDVASYYPSLILRTGIYPHQIGTQFAEIYGEWYARRLAAKRAGDKKNANSLKTLLNGTFGKLGSPYSIFYAPSDMVQVTLTGQLALLMLIEALELAGIQVLSANTDGIVVKAPRAMAWLRDAIIAEWERATGLVTEAAFYRLFASRDVNSYVAITMDGTVKTKGAYAPPEPGPSGWPNPTGQISTDACVSYLKDGTPIEQTVYACTDVRQFVHVRSVRGGGSWCPYGSLAKKATQKAMRDVVGPIVDKVELHAAYAARLAQDATQREYLGKVVRWYYATGCEGSIVTSVANAVARAVGCRPLMTLSDALPDDVDHAWYIQEARSLLADLGINNC